MVQQTVCPACGAPLEYEGEKDIVHCGFCSTDIAVIREGDDLRYEVVAQPEPQKEVLSHVVEPVVDPTVEPMAAAEAVVEPVSDFPAFFSAPPSREPVPAPPAYSSQPGAQVYAPSAPPPASATARNWLLISLGIVLGLCVLCACMVGVAALVFSVGMPMVW